MYAEWRLLQDSNKRSPPPQKNAQTAKDLTLLIKKSVSDSWYMKTRKWLHHKQGQQKPAPKMFKSYRWPQVTQRHKTGNTVWFTYLLPHNNHLQISTTCILQYSHIDRIRLHFQIAQVSDAWFHKMCISNSNRHYHPTDTHTHPQYRSSQALTRKAGHRN
jgi:hypothetical protein